MAHPERAVLMVVTAPAGAGKTTLCDRLLAEFPRLRYSISCTTRQPRGNEEDGVDYHFLSGEDFKKRIDAGDFLEYANVHGNWYGTLASTVQDALVAGDDIIMDIDVQGAQSLRSSIDEGDPFLRDAGADTHELKDSIARELVVFAERCDVSEELTRLHSHFTQTRKLFKSTKAVGRTLDFVCQELFREVNTIGSKANDAEMAALVVAFKAELERFREQVQNVE